MVAEAARRLTDRELAEARVFPAINLLSSGTRREDLLYSEAELTRSDIGPSAAAASTISPLAAPEAPLRAALCPQWRAANPKVASTPHARS